MSDVGGEFTENCGFEGKILCEVPQSCDTPATEYTPPDGYRVVQVGEVVQKDDIFLAVNGEHWPTKRIGETVNNNRYIRRIEVPQPCAPCDSGDTGDTPATGYTPPEGWRVLAVGELLQPGDQVVQLHDGKRYATERVGQYVCETQRYIRPIEPQPEPQPEPEPEPEPQPVQVREGRWRTRGGDIRNVTPTPECDNRHDRFPWRDTAYDQTWAVDGRYFVDREESPLDLDEYLGPIEPQSEPQSQSQPVSDADQQIRLLEQANHNHVAMIGRLQSRINDLETINAAQEKAVRTAGQENTDLQHRLNVVSAEWAEQSEINRRLQSELNSDASVSRLQADRNDLAGKVIVLREQLQLANDRLAQLEVLQPIAAACHTAQTMVRDMLGHMRCLLALHHTTDRRDSCTLLESILEVFDEAECDDGDNDEADSEAGQG